MTGFLRRYFTFAFARRRRPPQRSFTQRLVGRRGWHYFADAFGVLQESSAPRADEHVIWDTLRSRKPGSLRVRDLMRDLERVNRGETGIIHTCEEYPGAQLRSARCCSSRPAQKEDSKCNLRNLKSRSRLSKWSSAGASLELAVSSSNPRIAIRCANGIRSILDSPTKAKA